jgi:hypothetical protein
MQSDVLPFTAYDSMEYSTVQQLPAPQGFVKRDDVPQIQTRKPDTPNMLHPPPPQGATGGGGGTAVKQKPQEDINLDDFEDLAPKNNDIGNYSNMKDLVFIVIAVLAVDVAVIFLTRFFPDVFGSNLNRWYDLFGLNAVIADVMIIVIGFIIARYVYTGYIKNKFAEGKWSPLWFTGTIVATQLVHDLAFYYGVITQVPRGHNAMMDVFKDYAASGGGKILVGDALMVIVSVALSMFLKPLAPHIVASFGSLVLYALPYILYTKQT